MPDDSSADFKASQQRHSDEIRTRRTISQATGLSMNQVRARLNDFATTRQDQQAARNNVPTPVAQNLPPIPGANGQAMQFDPRPFSLTPNGATPTAPPGSAATLDDMIVVMSATAYEHCTINGTLGTPI